MKKSLLLGVAALAACQVGVGTVDAGEVKIGGYYMFRLINADNNVVKENANGGFAGADDVNGWAHRLQLNVDMKASEKSHAHMRFRVVDDGVVSGGDMGTHTALIGENTNVVEDNTAVPAAAAWSVSALWLETEAWGVGVKAGHMPLSFNDEILINQSSSSSFGAIMLSKNFGDVSVTAGSVKLNEANIGGMSANNANGVDYNNNGTFGSNYEIPVDAGGTVGANKDDVDLYILSLLGKGMGINYQVTAAYIYGQHDSEFANAYTNKAVNPNDSVTDWWLALTLEGTVADIKLTGTVIYENGLDNTKVFGAGNQALARQQAANSDFLVALRAKAKTGFGGWNAYAFYAGEDFTNLSNRTPEWSETWDASGPQANDLMNLVFDRSTSVSTRSRGNNWVPLTRGANMGLSSPTENIWGVGGGLTVKAGGWTIRPLLDYGHVAEADLNNDGVDELMIKSAWGGSLILSTPIEKDTELTLTAQYVDPSFTRAGNQVAANNGGGHCAAGATGPCDDTLHQLMADIKFKF